ncbi:ribosomal protein L7/L12 [Arsenicibacter rosenii]|uniref:Large ribosomal subunit protein bL12 C-terminal domain-containing protein n=1 Tax=Arsenicibacter rosenii TaxID=1750698 RepID=A0A1S2VQX4_9BACT|nr:ribosomal protein L7/L12 [Arsenicibacter rosenii]OIN60566.1 hypothetical protein BLX24_00105 [Arsenicibacter rosenii]
MMKTLLFIALFSGSLFPVAQSETATKQVQEKYVTVTLLRPKDRSTAAHVTKALVSYFGIHQRQAMEIVAAAPVIIAKEVVKEEAASIKSALEAAGAEVEVK